MLLAILPRILVLSVGRQHYLDLGFALRILDPRHNQLIHQLQHPTAKVVPMLKTDHKQARARFAKLALRRERCSWHRVLINDSKYFKLHAMGKHGRAGTWCKFVYVRTSYFYTHAK